MLRLLGLEMASLNGLRSGAKQPATLLHSEHCQNSVLLMRISQVKMKSFPRNQFEPKTPM